jgi:Tfp pilus assembly protein PilN
MEATTQSESARRRRAWLPWGLLVGAVALATSGAWAGSRSISALVDRNGQLEREAAESEARVAELQALREAQTRRLRTLEQQHQAAQAALSTATACTTPEAPPRPEPRRTGKATARGKKVARR